MDDELGLGVLRALLFPKDDVPLASGKSVIDFCLPFPCLVSADIVIGSRKFSFLKAGCFTLYLGHVHV